MCSRSSGLSLWVLKDKSMDLFVLCTYFFSVWVEARYKQAQIKQTDRQTDKRIDTVLPTCRRAGTVSILRYYIWLSCFSLSFHLLSSRSLIPSSQIHLSLLAKHTTLITALISHVWPRRCSHSQGNGNCLRWRKATAQRSLHQSPFKVPY